MVLKVCVLLALLPVAFSLVAHGEDDDDSNSSVKGKYYVVYRLAESIYPMQNINAANGAGLLAFILGNGPLYADPTYPKIFMRFEVVGVLQKECAWDAAHPSDCMDHGYRTCNQGDCTCNAMDALVKPGSDDDHECSVHNFCARPCTTQNGDFAVRQSVWEQQRALWYSMQGSPRPNYDGLQEGLGSKGWWTVRDTHATRGAVAHYATLRRMCNRMTGSRACCNAIGNGVGQVTNGNCLRNYIDERLAAGVLHSAIVTQLTNAFELEKIAFTFNEDDKTSTNIPNTAR